MKKIITGVILLASITFYGQNTFPSSGNVGIGTNSPLAKLDIRLGGWNNIPRILLKQESDHPSIRLYRPTGGSATGVYSWWIENSGYQGLSFKYGNGTSSGSEIVSSNVIFGINGRVGIGTTNPDKELTVAGTIHCEEVLVDLSVPADYVFQKYYTGFSSLKENYTMPTLEEVAAFTKENHHLPNVPSAATIQEEGLQLKEMTNILLQKIEELTLYTIEQEKRIKALEGKLATEK